MFYTTIIGKLIKRNVDHPQVFVNYPLIPIKYRKLLELSLLICLIENIIGLRSNLHSHLQMIKY